MNHKPRTGFPLSPGLFCSVFSRVTGDSAPAVHHLLSQGHLPEVMCHVAEAFPPCSLSEPWNVASTLVLGQTRCHSAYKLHLSPACTLLSEVTSTILRSYCIKKVLPVPFESCLKFRDDPLPPRSPH